LLIDAQREVEDTHRKLNSFEAELFALKEEKETLQLKLKEEKGRISILDQQKKSLQAAADEYKKKEVCSFLCTHVRRGKSKSKGTFQKKKKEHIYCKYTEMKLILLFNIINVTTAHSTLH